MKVLVMFAEEREWNGRQFRNVQYFEPMQSENEPGRKDVQALTVRGTAESMKSILAQPLPAMFDVDFGARPNFKGDPETSLVAAKLVKGVKVADLVPV